MLNFFTNHDIQLIFLKAKFIALENNAYESGVVCGKRLSYKVFREILVPCIAETRTSKPPCRESNDAVLKLLLQIPSDNAEVVEKDVDTFSSFLSSLKPDHRTDMRRALSNVV